MSVEALLASLEHLGAEVVERPYGWSARFPQPQGADYAFDVNIYEDGDATLSAARSGSDEGEYFWYRPFEHQGFDTLDQLHGALLETLGTLLTHETRIVQTRGLINVLFDCAYADGDEWRSIYGVAALRFSNFRFPEMSSKTEVYRAGPVMSSEALSECLRASGRVRG